MSYAVDYDEQKERYDKNLINGAAVVDLLDGVPSAALHGYQRFIDSLVVTVSYDE